MDSRRVWVVAIFLFVMGDAVATQIRGALLESFQSSFGVSEALLGLVAPAGTVGFVVSVLAIGFVSGRIDLKRTLLIGVAATVVSLLVMSVAPVYWLFLAVMVGQGAAAGAFRGVDRPILSHLYPSRRGRIFALYSLAWALGAVTGPVLVNAVLSVTDWRVTYAILGLFFVPIGLLIWQTELPASTDNEQSLSLDALRTLVRRPAVLGSIGCMALLGGIEGIFFTWLPYYASTIIPRDLANLLLSTFLLAYIPGRILNTWIIERVNYLYLTFGLTLASIPVLLVTFSGIGGWALFMLVFLAGFLISGLFPTILSFAVEASPEYSGPISAMTTGGTYTGIALAPLGVGVVAELVDIQTAMYLTLGLAIALLIGTVVTWAATRGSGRAGIPSE
ncbi:MFS transporter [Natranaeroarchaeum sulfidigenes]|uniref:MFS family permease n=1 Tax=Natranaeroarchaeum sulfidigenes TaxID=2784880 RepID=A0A897MS21_9EURY|nr:MFS transporter [Natranaeroarchaeum sulfidigenes]QSG03307.1 MFS family permease [Natranaeroarchaeum sulfidigenes]